MIVENLKDEIQNRLQML